MTPQIERAAGTLVSMYDVYVMYMFLSVICTHLRQIESERAEEIGSPGQHIL